MIFDFLKKKEKISPQTLWSDGFEAGKKAGNLDRLEMEKDIESAKETISLLEARLVWTDDFRKRLDKFQAILRGLTNELIAEIDRVKK